MVLQHVTALAAGLVVCAAAMAPATVMAQEADQAAPPEHVHPAPAAPDAAAQDHEHGETASLFGLHEASGTAWQPAVTPMRGVHQQSGGWQVMWHGNAFLQFLHESAPEHRGASQGGSLNWVMGMARRPVGTGLVGVRAMLSLEPLTVPGCGYPNLLQTGEICNGDTIHDKQHPHDLFMELAVELDRPLVRSLRWQLYGGPAGEPALGPPGFPHRLSAGANPISPISHHWLDATHITFGLVTAGVHGPRWKAEASAFNGREPDEKRYDIDFGPLDSISTRLSFSPRAAWTTQVSIGHLAEAEFDPGLPPADVTRTTASLTHHRRVRETGVWATTIGWGANRERGTTTHALLLESAVDLTGRDTLFGRMETTGKPAHDLHVHESNEVFTVAKLQGGYTRYLPPRRGLQTGAGASVSAAIVPLALQPRYGGVGLGFGVFLTVRPAAHLMTP
jgi:hypothetical protein